MRVAWACEMGWECAWPLGVRAHEEELQPEVDHEHAVHQPIDDEERVGERLGGREEADLGMPHVHPHVYGMCILTRMACVWHVYRKQTSYGVTRATKKMAMVVTASQ